jgi:hypothetical protein
MIPEPWLPTRVEEYLVAVVWQWWGVFSTAFFLMRLVPILFPSSGRVVEWLQRERQVFLGLAMALFMIANFRVFDEDRRDLRTLKASPASVDWSALPKSPSGLQSGKIWNNGGIPSIVP